MPLNHSTQQSVVICRVLRVNTQNVSTIFAHPKTNFSSKKLPKHHLSFKVWYKFELTLFTKWMKLAKFTKWFPESNLNSLLQRPDSRRLNMHKLKLIILITSAIHSYKKFDTIWHKTNLCPVQVFTVCDSGESLFFKEETNGFDRISSVDAKISWYSALAISSKGEFTSDAAVNPIEAASANWS